jgi:hypothetical protein
MPWNSLEVVKLGVSLLTPLVVAFLGYRITLRVKEQEQRFTVAREKEREDQRRQYEQQNQLAAQEREARNEELRQQAQRRIEREGIEREAQREERERRYTPHIGLRLDCQFLGTRNDQHLAVISVYANNAGQVMHEFQRINLRIRGIKNEPFAYWKGKEPHAQFPHKVLETNLVPNGWNFIFIEPGVNQRLSLNTLISADYTYLLVHVEFEYKKYWPHTADAVIAVPRKVEANQDARQLSE